MAEPHASDCSVNNGPAYPPGPCDCGAADIVAAVLAEREACALIAKRLRDLYADSNGEGDPAAKEIAGDIEWAIRARSKD